MARPYFDMRNNSWKIKIKGDNGTWKPVTLGKGDGTATPPASVLARAAELTTPAPAPVAVQVAPGDLRHYTDLYQRRHSCKGVNGVRRRAGVLARFVAWADSQGLKTLGSIGTPQFRLWIDHRRDNDKAVASTIVSDIACLQGMFAKAIKDHLILENPAKEEAKEARVAERKSRPDEEIKYYTRDQQARVLDALRFAMPKYRDLAKVMLATGMRVNACRHMQASWISTDGKWMVKVPRSLDKGGSGYTTHVFNIDTNAREVIERRRAEYPTGSIFQDIRSESIAYHYFQEFFKRHEMSDIADLGSYNHVFRHTFAVRRVENGISIPVLQKFMGHHDIRITMRYAKVSDHAMLEAIAAIEAIGGRPS